MAKYLKDHEKHFPELIRAYTIGSSKEGKPIIAAEITSDVTRPTSGRSSIAFIGTLHGYDVIGVEVLLMSVHQLTKKYKENDPRVVKLLKNVRIHVIPAVNVDGIARAVKGDCDGSLYDGADFYNQFFIYSGKKESSEVSMLYFSCCKLKRLPNLGSSSWKFFGANEAGHTHHPFSSSVISFLYLTIIFRCLEFG